MAVFDLTDHRLLVLGGAGYINAHVYNYIANATRMRDCIVSMVLDLNLCAWSGQNSLS